MSKHKITAGVVSQEMISDGIYSLWIEAAPIAADAVPGQFISLYCAEGTRLLPRPISLCEIDKENGRLHLVYRVAGKGTEEFSALKAGDTIEVLGPLGNGFPLTDKKAVLVGGGIGVPPIWRRSWPRRHRCILRRMTEARARTEPSWTRSVPTTSKQMFCTPAVRLPCCEL